MKKLHPTLPIHALRASDSRWIVYVPGSVTVVSTRQLAEAERELRSRPSSRLARHLVECAERVTAEWRRLAERPYEPSELLLYLNNSCDCSCSYCFAASARADGSAPATPGESGALGTGRVPVLRLPVAAVESAAAVAAEGAADKHRPLRVVFHGGGEPTADGDHLKRLVEVTRTAAREAGVQWQGTLATNGQMEVGLARWAARTFDHVGLSCDGPPDIQDRQRPFSSGAPSSAGVERTARVLREEGTAFSVRTTITPETVARQTEIVQYLVAVLGTREMRFHPLYGVAPAPARFVPEEAPAFVAGFLAAQEVAEGGGSVLVYNGVRLEELHGPYCPVNRDVLQLAPDGWAVGCFFALHRGAPGSLWHMSAGLPEIGLAAANRHRRLALEIPGRCRDCLCAYHCIRECPEKCMVTGAGWTESDGAPGFRCLVNLGLAQAWLERLATGTPEAVPGEAKS